MQPDPIYVVASALTVAVILASAATHKLRAPMRFAHQLEDYQLVPGALVGLLARLIPALEVVIALGMLIPTARSTASLAACALLAAYAAAIGINLWRGRHDIDCGCAGPDQAQPLRPQLLLRNAILVGLGLLASIEPLSRQLGLFDGFVILAASATALLLYAATDGLLANAPRLLKLIGR